MRTSRLTAVLERTLDAKAAQAADPEITAAAPRFDPHRPSSTAGLAPVRRHDGTGGLLKPVPVGTEDLSGDVDDLDLSPVSTSHGPRATHRRRARLRVPAAACVAVAVAVAGAVVLQDGGGGGTEDADVAVRPLELGDPPDGWLVPTWVPDGMELWGIDTTSYEQPDDSVPDTIPQLFGDPAGDRALYITSHRYEISPTTARDVAVRGTTGTAGTAWGAAEDEHGTAVRWDERGVTISALYRGVSQEEAIAFLDTLEWRTDDPLDGFAPPTDDTWPLRAEATTRSTVTRDASLIYSDGVPGAAGVMSLGLWVQTTSSSAISAGYLDTWYLEGSGDGTAPLVTSRDVGEVGVFWPDGRSVSISSRSLDGAGSSLPLDVLERIARSTDVVSTADLTAVRDAVGNRIEALPLVATADTPIGAAEIHADGDLIRLCLRRPGAPGADCDTSTMGGGAGDDGSALATAQWIVDGAWYITVASRGEVPQVFGSTDRTTRPSTDGELEAVTTEVGEWTVQLVQPPADVESVCAGDDEAMSCTAQRRE